MRLRLAPLCAALTAVLLLAACDPDKPEKPADISPSVSVEPSPLPSEILEACGLPPGSTVMPTSCPGLLGPDNIGVPS
ncbi:hypothetical protein BJY16_005704 [Actinoplanes octamycinicus]|uniref:Uncharacterized protein n=1 Tax=Actinoplanes octamycinicus TaxID=135948 RepID=A0A7W7M9X0_9ACTN|nr:hypothetical protein [Actinoplanes octamycinicus]MBB4742245.1 hypothetical protein [Actinoplanes octamycinicus]GIE59910.1 hypothetical protein Aoc01nite_53120 [Actinoplanes octamycinicus]